MQRTWVRNLSLLHNKNNIKRAHRFNFPFSILLGWIKYSLVTFKETDNGRFSLIFRSVMWRNIAYHSVHFGEWVNFFITRNRATQRDPSQGGTQANWIVFHIRYTERVLYRSNWTSSISIEVRRSVKIKCWSEKRKTKSERRMHVGLSFHLIKLAVTKLPSCLGDLISTINHNHFIEL